MKVYLPLFFLLLLLLLGAGFAGHQVSAHPADRAAAPVGLAIATDLTATGGYSVTVPIAFQNGGNAVGSTTFSLDFDEGCLRFDPTDTNQDGRPEAVRIGAPLAFRGSVAYDATDQDGELDVVIADYSLPIASLPDLAELLAIRFTATCIPAAGAVITAPVRFSTAPVASFGDVTGLDVAGTTVDGLVTIGFDAPVNTATPTPSPTITPTLTPSSTSTPGPGTPTSTPTVLPTATPGTAHLAVADLQASPGTTTTVLITLERHGHQIAAATFALGLDPTVLNLDLADANADGIPDAVVIQAPTNMERSVAWNAAAQRLEVALFGTNPPLPTLADGRLAAVTLTVAAAAAEGTLPLPLTLVTLGDADGNDLAVNVTNGTLTIVTTRQLDSKRFLPWVVR